MAQLGIDECLAERLEDPGDPTVITHPWVELLRTAVLLPSQRWRDLRDAELLRHDPALRLAVSERRGDAPLRAKATGTLMPDGLASQPPLSCTNRPKSTYGGRRPIEADPC